MRISSAIGESGPVNLVVVPIVFEDQVLGVIEAGSFWPFTQVQRDFLEQLMETIGVNVNTMIANARTDALLAESQRLTRRAAGRGRTGSCSDRTPTWRTRPRCSPRRTGISRPRMRRSSRRRQEIEERARQLDLASRYKSQFLANMSHELRTPLNSLLVLARLLAQNPAQQSHPQAGGVREHHPLLRLGPAAADQRHPRPDQGRGREDGHPPERFALAWLIEDLEAVFGPLTEEKGLRFTIATAPGVPADVVTDKQRLRQILYNLLSNAVKFTEQRPGRAAHRDRAPAPGTGAVVVLGDRHRHRHQPRTTSPASSPPSSRPTAPPAAATAAPGWAWPSAARSPPSSAARSPCKASSAPAAPSACTCRSPRRPRCTPPYPRPATTRRRPRRPPGPARRAARDPARAQGPDRGRRPAQRLRPHRRARDARRHGRASHGRAQSDHRASRRRHRLRPDGRDDAADGRARDHPRDPPDAASSPSCRSSP